MLIPCTSCTTQNQIFGGILSWEHFFWSLWQARCYGYHILYFMTLTEHHVLRNWKPSAIACRSLWHIWRQTMIIQWLKIYGTEKLAVWLGHGTQTPRHLIYYKRIPKVLHSRAEPVDLSRELNGQYTITWRKRLCTVCSPAFKWAKAGPSRVVAWPTVLVNCNAKTLHMLHTDVGKQPPLILFHGVELCFKVSGHHCIRVLACFGVSSDCSREHRDNLYWHSIAHEWIAGFVYAFHI